MSGTIGWLPAPADELFGTEATAEESYEVLTVDVPPTSWLTALKTARDRLSCTYFDWLSAVDEPGTGFRVSAHVVALAPVRRLLLRTTVPHEAPTLPTAVGVYAGAAWHERETHEMFGVHFEGHPSLDHLLLPETFEGHPLRKDFVLAARVAKSWPGAKEPGESDHGGPKRRQMLPPGVPDPNEWGPLKGQLPPAPTRPARATGRAAGDRPARAAGERPVRRARTAAEGSASQTEAATPGTPAAPDAPPGARPRRARSAAEGSVSQTSAPAQAETPPEAEAPARLRRARTAAQGSASQQAVPRTPGSPDAPWHHARPAFEESDAKPDSERGHDGSEGEPTSKGEPDSPSEPDSPDKPRSEGDLRPEGEPSPQGSSQSAPGTGPEQASPTQQPPTSDPETDSPQPPEDPAGGPQ
ncbi:NADH-quinone oxidoreductase subunit C [Streptomyces sp. NPDC001617]